MKPPTDKPLHILHAHSKWSILDGAATVDEYLAYAREHGLGACGMTEHGMVIGWHDLITKSHKAGIKPIPGNEIYLMPRDGYNFIGKPYKYNHLTLWARNETGFRNLMAISSASWGQDRIVKSFGLPKPRVTWQDLGLYGEGIICGSGCIEGPIAKPFLRGEIDEACRNAHMLKEIFGDRLFFEVMPHAVDRNYTEEVAEVENERGFKFTFALTDTVETPFGRLTIKEAMERGVSEISDPIPARAGNGPLTDDPQRKVGKTDESVYVDDEDEIFTTPRTIRRVTIIPGEENDDVENEQ